MEDIDKVTLAKEEYVIRKYDGYGYRYLCGGTVFGRYIGDVKMMKLNEAIGELDRVEKAERGCGKNEYDICKLVLDTLPVEIVVNIKDSGGE